MPFCRLSYHRACGFMAHGVETVRTHHQKVRNRLLANIAFFTRARIVMFSKTTGTHSWHFVFLDSRLMIRETYVMRKVQGMNHLFLLGASHAERKRQLALEVVHTQILLISLTNCHPRLPPSHMFSRSLQSSYLGV